METMFILLLIYLMIYILWKLYEFNYYEGDKFAILTNKIAYHINECNNLNKHIENLKNTPLGFNQLDFGIADYSDNSIWNYSRPKYKNVVFAPFVYNCSRTVCDNARKQPFKYICKYFNVKTTDASLSAWENVLNNYNAVENGKRILQKQKSDIMLSIKKEIPFLIRCLSKKLERKLGFENIDLKNTYFPTFIFNYVSSGGYASTNCTIVLDLNNLNRFVVYLSECVKFKKSVLGQRALMTTNLRNKILQRDNYTCQICKRMATSENYLLLEVDHIYPLSKGGMTTISNLRTLCWKCNRTKGNKLLTENIPTVANEQQFLIGTKRYCKHCGAQNIDQHGYCNNCGMKQ